MTQVWKCRYPKCKTEIKEEEEHQFYEDVVRLHISTHISMHTPADSDKSHPKDRADWTTMEKWAADMYQVGKKLAADFDNFEKLINVVLNEASMSE